MLSEHRDKDRNITRREFVKNSATTLAVAGLSADRVFSSVSGGLRNNLSGHKRTKVKVARLYMGTSHGLWPKPDMDFQKEIRFYQNQFGKLKDELSDVDFVADELVTSPESVAGIRNRLKDVDGILAIHFNIGIMPILHEILKTDKHTMVFAIPYSGHEWVGFGNLRNQPLGAKMDCILTSDTNQLAAAVRPFRAIHQLQEAKILNLSTRSSSEYTKNMRDKFGTEIRQIDLNRMMDAYHRTDDKNTKREAEKWIQGAEQVVEPSREEIFKSSKLALAMERLLHEEKANILTIDCYGSMWDKTIKLPAYPCLGFCRLNNMGLGGICESDLPSAMTHLILQGLTGRPGFISDPTVDESNNSIILAHCMGTTHMDGPLGPSAPYKLRSVMERREGVVPQVEMRIGEKVTQTKLIGTDRLIYFTGEIIGTPVAINNDRGCRTQITVQVDGDVRKLWKNWSHGLHRQTCYGDITRDLEHFCRFMEIQMIHEIA